jgi:hypothetical protein
MCAVACEGAVHKQHRVGNRKHGWSTAVACTKERRCQSITCTRNHKKGSNTHSASSAFIMLREARRASSSSSSWSCLS